MVKASEFVGGRSGCASWLRTTENRGRRTGQGRINGSFGQEENEVKVGGGRWGW